MAPLKRKGDIAELRVAADLAARGCHVLIPFGEDCDYDLAAEVYTSATVDWIAVYDPTSDRCYYVPSWMLGVEGVAGGFMLRLVPALNNQTARIRPAEDYLDPDFSRDPSVEPAGFEPAASALQTRRSAN